MAGAAVAVPVVTQAAGPKTYTAAASPATVEGGRELALTVRLSNTARTTQDFKAANVTVPTGLEIVGSPSAAGPSGVVTGTATLVGRVIQVRDATVPKGKYLDVSIAVRVGCNAVGTYTWATDVRQSNDFNGTDNKFERVGNEPSTVVTTTCQLAFTGQPADAGTDTAITTTPLNEPPGGPVQVSILDGRTTGAAVVTWASTSVGLTLAGGAAGASLSGGGATAATDGVATFSALTVDTAGDGYTLQASASGPGFTGATSTSFDIGRFSASIDCQAGDTETCTTGTIESTGGDTAVVTVNDSDGLTANLTASFGDTTFSCAGYAATSAELIFGIQDIEGGDPETMTKTVVFTQPADPNKSELWEYQVCFQADYAFPGFQYNDLLEAFTNADYVVDPVDGLYTALLLPCSAGQGVPCVNSRTELGTGDIQITFTTKAADPGARF